MLYYVKKNCHTNKKLTQLGKNVYSLQLIIRKFIKRGINLK
jgi:hypothetical protein